MDDAPGTSTSRLPASRLPFYYGWVMIPVTVLGSVVVCPGQTFGIAEFKGALLRDLDLSETSLSGLYMFATLLAGLTAMVAGAAVDRYGLRRAITITVVLMGASCVYASRVQGMVSLFVAFTLLRILGHGALPLMTGNTLAMWFRRRLGLVTGITGVGSASVAAGVPALYLWLINSFGWRTALVILGAATWAIMLPIMAFVFRNRPIDVGQHVDGAATDDHHETMEPAKRAQLTEGASFNLSGARRTRAYWILLALSGAHGMIFAAVMFHRVQIFESHDLTQADAAAMFALFCLCSAAAQLLTAFFADRVPLNLILTCSCAGVTAGLLVLIHLDSLFAGYAFGCLYGLSTGAEVVGRNTAWPIYFGTRHLGKIKGRAAMVTVMGSSLGPFIVGVSYDHLGGHNRALWLLAVVYGVIACAMLFGGRPRRA